MRQFSGFGRATMRIATGATLSSLLGPSKRTNIQPSAGAGTYSALNVKAKHPDNVVLEVRRLHEQCAMAQVEIGRRLRGAGVSISDRDVHRYVSYQTRGRLVPEPDAAPYI